MTAVVVMVVVMKCINGGDVGREIWDKRVWLVVVLMVLMDAKNS